MPTYEYYCLRCNKKFEALQKMTARPLKKCVHCGGKAERLISGGTSLVFKESGFYITDYKKKSPSATGDSAPSAKPDPLPSKKAESKKEKSSGS